MPSGKTLWLCSEHAQMSRVMVLDQDDWDVLDSATEGAVSHEFTLLARLKEIVEGVKVKEAEDANKGIMQCHSCLFCIIQWPSANNTQSSSFDQ